MQNTAVTRLPVVAANALKVQLAFNFNFSFYFNFIFI